MKGVMGLIEKKGKFLFGIEAKEGPRQGKWRLLGGKLEGNESASEAMIRECLEEAQIKIEVKDFLGEIAGDLNEIMVEICYTKWISGKIKANPSEIGSLKWFTLEEAKKLDKDKISARALILFEEKYRKHK